MAIDEGGEVNLLLRDIKMMSEEIMHDLMDVDGTLEKLHQQALNEGLDTVELANAIRDIRVRIGSIEREESEELEAEDITQSLLEKLTDVIEKCLK